MNSVSVITRKKPFALAVTVALCALIAASVACAGRTDNSSNQPPAAATNAPAQPTSAPAQQTEAQATEAAQPTESQPTAAPAQPTAAQPTVAPQPTQAVQQDDSQGDEIEQLLDQLDQQNQKDDPLTDVPQ